MTGDDWDKRLLAHRYGYDDEPAVPPSSAEKGSPRTEGPPEPQDPQKGTQRLQSYADPLAQQEIDRLRAENERLKAETQWLRKNHANLTSRMGFGDGVTEPQADNDTIMRAWDEMSSQSVEWLESEAWRTDCYLAGHPDTEDCHEHDPSLRLLNAEAALARVEAEVAESERITLTVTSNRRIRAALAGEGS